MLNIKVLILFIASLFTLVGNTYAGSIKEEYILKERCGKSAVDFYKMHEEKLGAKIPGVYSNYTGHYNKKLNKCFILISLNSRHAKAKYLYDIHENNLLGMFYMKRDSKENMKCFVLDNSGSKFLLLKDFTEDGWDAAVKSYMEE